MNKYLSQFKSRGTGRSALLGLIMSIIVCIGCIFQNDGFESEVEVVLFEHTSATILLFISVISGISFLAHVLSSIMNSRRKYVVRSFAFLCEALYLTLLAQAILQDYPPLNVTAFVFALLALYNLVNAMFALNEEGKANDIERTNTYD